MNFKKYQNLISIISILLIVGAISFYFFNSGSSLEDILEQSNVEIIRNGDGFFQIINVKDFDVNWGTKDDPSLVSFKSKGSFLNIQLPLKEISWKREGNKIQANHGPFTFSYELIKNKKGEGLGIKEEIIIKERTKGNVQFKFPLSSNNLELKKEEEIWHFYNKENGEEVFYIPKPFMVDSNGNRSENVEIDFKDGFLIITPNQSWLQKAKYPVRIDPTFKLSILDLHSHPQTGDNWRVRFETEGEGDLKIIPNDQATIDDIEFTSLECNGKKLEPEILEGDVIYYPNWSCNKIAEINHHVKKAAPHKLRFEFRGEVKYARNSPDQYLIYDFAAGANEYDLTDTTDNSAYEKGGSLPSSPTDYDNEAGSSDYTNLESSNNSRWQTDLATTSNYYNSQIYNFKIDESTSTIAGIDIEWEGYSSSTQNTIYLKAYNYTNSTWTDITSLTSATTTDQTLEGVVSNINDYLNGSSTFTVMAGVKTEPFSFGDDVTFTYNGSSVTYGTVATSGECWMDRNLGASREAQSYDDSEAYGDLFQWGRPDDGHQERSSGETSTLADSDHPGHSDFINSPSDWRDPQNDNMWNTDGSGSNDGEICPEGWHVPSKSEWSSVSSNWSDRSDAFNSVLKLPCGGFRDYSDGSIILAGSRGLYWSSSVGGTGAGSLYFYSSDVNFSSGLRAYGSSVRCLRDSDSFCGDGIVEGTEECDGDNMDGNSCTSLGYDGGTLGCQNCTYDTSDCYETFSCGDDVTFTYNGSEVTYGIVATSGECWMDRNLGASRVATAYNDSDSYGDLVQWGRADDGHQERTSATTSVLADSDHPGHSGFITDSTDWRDPQNDNMWNTDGSGSNDGEICPEGWHVPSKSEWSSVSSNWSDRSDAFNSVLKLPCGAFRDYSDGSIILAGSRGLYWSSSVVGTGAGSLYFYSSDVNFSSGLRAYGSSVRCLRDSDSFCGDGIVEGTEECDGDNMDGNSCTSLGYDGGTLGCQNCTYDTSDCYETFSCGDDVTFTYNGSEVTYGIVATSGECWMDRNLGASRVATAYNDSDSYGDLVQWGRPDDGHQERTSATTSVLADSDHPGHSGFITDSTDWRDPQNDNMWNTDGSGSNDGEICPEGWRVPSETEWSSVSSNWSDRSDAFNSVLKLPSAGYRYYSDGSIYFAGSNGYYWSSSVGGTGAGSLYFYSSDVNFSSGLRAYGSSVRCLRDSDSFCGDGIVEGTEECDGDNMDGNSCTSLGYDGGTLGCQNCTYDTSDCYETFSCGDDVTFTYNGSEVTYGIVATSGECWMDRNLGASRVATAYNDSDSYGDLVQWGRADDGHQERTSATTSVLADSDHPGHSGFITDSTDWRDPQNDNMWNTD